MRANTASAKEKRRHLAHNPGASASSHALQRWLHGEKPDLAEPKTVCRKGDKKFEDTFEAAARQCEQVFVQRLKVDKSYTKACIAVGLCVNNHKMGAS